ncbi:MAG: S8 family peptidase [Saprospiraceae bacterium]
MPRLLIKCVFICIFFIIYLTDISGQSLLFVPGEYIVQVKSDNSIQQFRSSITNFRVKNSAIDLSYSQLMREPFNLWLIDTNKAGLSDSESEKLLGGVDGFLSVRKNRYITNRTIPDDTDFAKQWQYINDGSSGGSVDADIDMELAWDVTTGGITSLGDTVVICVIDDGINAAHEDLQGNVWLNYNEIPGNGIDDDNNGYIDDFRGWNITSKNDNVYSGGSHGTPVAGIIGARGNNKLGVSGVNWKVKIMPVNYGFSSEANALASYGYAYTQRKLYNTSKGTKGAFIVATNASWGIDDLNAADAPLWCSLFDSLGKIGILNCAATTNNNTDVDVKGDMPTSCNSEYLISVTNLSRSDAKVSSAGFGRKSIDLGAYGNQVYTLTRTGYGPFGGTSGASPHVTGVIGLIYSAPCNIFQNLVKTDPAAAALVAKDMILHGTLPNATLKDITTTGGKLNANRAVRNIMKLCQNCSIPAGIIIKTEDLLLRIFWQNDQGSSQVNIRYRQVDKVPWTEVLNISNGSELKGFSNCTEYEVQIGSDCGFLPSGYSYSKFIKTSGCCEIPTISSLQSDLTSVGVAWVNTQDASFNVEYKSAAGKWVDTVTNDHSFVLKNIPECTAYTFKVKANCSRYGNISEFTPEYNVSTGCGSCTENRYCTFGRKDASQEWIEAFTLNNIENKSGNISGGYRDFTGFNRNVLETSKIYDFIIQCGYSGTPFPDYFKIYIDYDQNGIWSTDELAYKSPTSLANEVKGKITIPAKAIGGFTKLRLIMSYQAFDGGCDDSKFEYGEVEDYCVLIKNSLCTNNMEVKTEEIEQNSVKIIRKKTTIIQDTLRVSYRLKGSLTWQQITSLDTIKINNLKECSVYEYRFQKNCDSLYSDFSVIDTFKTACKNNVNDPSVLFKISPNPAFDELYIEIPDGLFINELMVSDISGRIILANTSAQKSILNISSLPSGTYLLILTTSSGQRYRQKFLKF